MSDHETDLAIERLNQERFLAGMDNDLPPLEQIEEEVADQVKEFIPEPTPGPLEVWVMRDPESGRITEVRGHGYRKSVERDPDGRIVRIVEEREEA